MEQLIVNGIPALIYKSFGDITGVLLNQIQQLFCLHKRLAFSGIFLAFKCPVALVFSQIISYLSQSKLETPKTLSKGVCANKTIAEFGLVIRQPVNNFVKSSDDGECYGKTKKGIKGGGSTERYPRSVQIFPSDKQKEKLHPTQKLSFSLLYVLISHSIKSNGFCVG
jgi:hypothetical protein